MTYIWLPRGYKILWVVFMISLIGWVAQTLNPDMFNTPLYYNMGRKMTLLTGAILIILTLWILGNPWERSIQKKIKRPYVEMTLIDRFYGGVVFIRRIPPRIWDAAEDEDRLVKPAWSFRVHLRPLPSRAWRRLNSDTDRI